MPDTAILPSPWRSEHLVMDKEVSDRFDHQDEALREIKEVVKSTQTAMTTHLITYAGEHAATKAEVNGVGQRLNEHLQASERMRPFWFAVIMAAISGVVKVLWDLVKNK
jgi:hypothetical protein